MATTTTSTTSTTISTTTPITTTTSTTTTTKITNIPSDQTVIKVKTGSNPSDRTDGYFSLQLLSPEGACTIKNLDNKKKNDRELGAVDTYTGEMIEPCKEFHPEEISSVKFTHLKGEGWRGEYLTISYGNKSFTCKLGKVEKNAGITFPFSDSVGKL